MDAYYWYDDSFDFGNSSISDYNNSVDGFADYNRGLYILRWTMLCGIFPLCILGLAGNSLSIWVWHANKKHRVALLFQYLGLADNFLLLFMITYWSMDMTKMLSDLSGNILSCMILFWQTLSVHITLTIGVFRWLAVARPHWMPQMSRRPVLGMCGALVIWSGVLAVCSYFRLTKLKAWTVSYAVVWILINSMAFILPIVMLMGFSLAVIVTFHQKVFLNHKERMHRKLTKAVLCIAGFTCMAYPVSTAINIAQALEVTGIIKDISCTWTCYFVSICIITVLQVLNSSVNFVIYFTFATSFRNLLCQDFQPVLSTFSKVWPNTDAMLTDPTTLRTTLTDPATLMDQT